jgi:hypothetical protein
VRNPEEESLGVRVLGRREDLAHGTLLRDLSGGMTATRSHVSAITGDRA